MRWTPFIQAYIKILFRNFREYIIIILCPKKERKYFGQKSNIKKDGFGNDTYNEGWYVVYVFLGA